MNRNPLELLKGIWRNLATQMQQIVLLYQTLLITIIKIKLDQAGQDLKF